MSLDIDMESYGSNPAPESVAQPQKNSYQEAVEDYPLYPDLLDSSTQEQGAQPEVEASNSQSENFRALREEIERIKSEKDQEKKEYQLQIDMLRANLQDRNKAPELKPQRMFEGMDESDVPNVKEIRGEWEKRENAYQERIAELEVQQKYSDYNEVVSKYIPSLAKENPLFLEGLNHSSNKSLYAYQLAKMAQKLDQPTQNIAPVNENAQRIVANAAKPRTLSSAGGQSAINQADYISSMSDQEFYTFAKRHLEAI